jgi:Tetratricopeptide repeat
MCTNFGTLAANNCRPINRNETLTPNMTAARRRAKPSAGKADITSPRTRDWADRAEALIQKRSYAAAMRLLRAATDKKHVFPETRLKLARCQFHLGDVSSALKGLRRVATASAELRRAALEKLAVYCPGSPNLYSGKVEAEITAITNHSTGRKVQFVYGSVTASINPAQGLHEGAKAENPHPHKNCKNAEPAERMGGRGGVRKIIRCYGPS